MDESDESGQSTTTPDEGAPGRRLSRALSPIAAGFLLDLVDLGTFGPIGLYGGFLVGGAVGWWLASGFDLTRKRRAALVVAAAIYAGTPATELLPLGTLAGVISKLRTR